MCKTLGSAFPPEPYFVMARSRCTLLVATHFQSSGFGILCRHPYLKVQVLEATRSELRKIDF